MPITFSPAVREVWGEEVADEVARRLDETFQQRAVSPDQWREVLSRLDVIEERFGQVDERFEQVDRRFEQVDRRFERIENELGAQRREISEQLDRMNGRILSMTRWLIGLLVVFGTMVTVLLAVAQFTAG